LGITTFSQTRPSDEHIKDATRRIDVPLSWIATHLAHNDKLAMLIATLLHHRICDSSDLVNQNLSLNKMYGFQESNKIFAFNDALLNRLELLIDPERMKAFLAGVQE
jgi:hypothetical protein